MDASAVPEIYVLGTWDRNRKWGMKDGDLNTDADVYMPCMIFVYQTKKKNLDKHTVNGLRVVGI
jgi:hypothetical protein